MKSEDNEFWADVAKAARERLNITDETAGIFTDNQKRLLRLLAEGRTVWTIEARRNKKDSGWEFVFNFLKGRNTGGNMRVVLDEGDMINLRHHLDFFSAVGMCTLSPDIQNTLELDYQYEDQQKDPTKESGHGFTEVFLGE